MECVLSPRMGWLCRQPLAHPALHKSNLSPELPGDVIALPGAHAKIRRDGYRTDHQ
jgi:hypothetical protein